MDEVEHTESRYSRQVGLSVGKRRLLGCWGSFRSRARDAGAAGLMQVVSQAGRPVGDDPSWATSAHEQIRSHRVQTGPSPTTHTRASEGNNVYNTTQPLQPASLKA